MIMMIYLMQKNFMGKHNSFELKLVLELALSFLTSTSDLFKSYGLNYYYDDLLY